MICEACETQFKNDDIQLSWEGSCPICGRKLKLHHILDGYWFGVLGSAIPVYVLIFGARNGGLFLPVATLGPVLTFIFLKVMVRRAGTSEYRSISEFKKWEFLKKIAGAILGFGSALAWFLYALRFLSSS